jgi:hypothetical protein
VVVEMKRILWRALVLESVIESSALICQSVPSKKERVDDALLIL